MDLIDTKPETSVFICDLVSDTKNEVLRYITSTKIKPRYTYKGVTALFFCLFPK